MMPASNLDMEFMPENWMLQRGTSKQSDARLTKYSAQKDSFQGLLKREVKKPIAFGYTYAYVKERLDMVRTLVEQARIKALLKVWLYVHVPVAFALCVALAIHIFSVFFFW